METRRSSIILHLNNVCLELYFKQFLANSSKVTFLYMQKN